VGSGPAGLACAQQLARAGHDVVLYEKADRIGGLLRYGIPDFKLERHLIDRRMAQMSAEGVEFRPGVHVGRDVAAAALVAEFDAVALTGGAEAPRDLPVPGRDLAGIHFAMEFLPQQNRVVAGDRVQDQIVATGKHVIVIGGGDTGSDCVGTSNRQRAKSVTQFELLPQPPQQENKPVTWPYWPVKLRTSSSHQEGCDRDWAVATKRFEGSDGRVEKLVAVRVEWRKDESGAMKMVEVPGSEFEMKADLVLLAMGFTGPVRAGMLEELAVAHDPRGNVRADTEDYRTSVPKVFAAGDMRRGQSLVVWAIREGRQCARAVDQFLMGSSELPR
jgi:glutamate synthase (NADPH/NADH) small chain